MKVSVFVALRQLLSSVRFTTIIEFFAEVVVPSLVSSVNLQERVCQSCELKTGRMT
jgi:hypothetical protein